MYDAQLAVAAHMEIASPSIKEAVAQCAMQGYKQIIIAPYFLSQGRHIQQDIPALVAEAQAEHPDLACIIAEPIGMVVLEVYGDKAPLRTESCCLSFH